MERLSPRVQAWRAQGELVELGGRRIFVHQREGAGPPLFFLHGYPSSSWDWHEVLHLLPGRRIVCFDFLGFGFSEKPRDHRYSLFSQADLAEAVARRFVGESAILIAHDMGTSVATELLARDLEGKLPFQLQRVLLLNGSMILEKATLTLSQRILRSPFGPLLARLSSERIFRAQFKRIFSSAHPLTEAEAEDQWSLLVHLSGNRILDRLTYYLHERLRFAARWHGALRDWRGPLELVWAMRDPICTAAVLDAILALRPQAKVTRLPELGHYPQVEDPKKIAAIIDRFGAGE